MLITVDDGRSLGVVFGSMFPVSPEAQNPRTVRTSDGQTSPKLSKDGRSATYRTGLTAFRLDDEGNPVGEDRDTVLAVRKPAAIEAGKQYLPAGRTYVVHYVNDRGRLAVSIEAETVVPKKAE